MVTSGMAAAALLRPLPQIDDLDACIAEVEALHRVVPRYG
jgi:hypothetical protein